jgi:phosphatidylinositol alpha-1,6-mannosyltransferase
MISYIHGEEVTTASDYRYFGQHRKKYLRHADAIVAVSNFTKNALMRVMDVPAEKITLIHNGVDTEKFTPGEKSADLVDRHNLQGKKIILTVGRLVPRKGLDTVIRSLPTIIRKAPDTHYLIVGDGEYRPTLERLVKEFGLASYVTFTGRVAENELIDYYRLCDVFAMPNREMPNGDTEGFGLVFLEANACGKAVVAGRAGGAVEAVRAGRNGLVVDGWSVDNVAQSLIQLLTDDSLRQIIANRGLEIALALSSKAKAEEFYSLCQNLTRR